MKLSESPTEPSDVDARLLQAMAQGQADALDEFVVRNRAWIRGLVFAVCRRAHMVDDVMQHVWLSVWRRAGSLSNPERWRSWLYTLATRAAIDVARADTRHRRLLDRFFGHRGGAGHRPAREPDKLELSEDHQRALRAVRALPDPYKSAFVLRHLSEFSYREIADAMGLPDGSVGTLLMRARKLLRDALGEEVET